MNMKIHRLNIALLGLATLVACGGTSSGGRGSTTPPPSGGGGNGGAANPPVIVNVAAGQTASGVNVDVPAPAGSPAPNATLLGATAAPPGGGSVSISLSNTGSTVKRGTSYVVALIGDGLSANMTITLSGPADVNIDATSVKGFTATNGKPGISFQIAVGANAVLGARSILLKNTQSDITSFTGGLEVVQ